MSRSKHIWLATTQVMVAVTIAAACLSFWGLAQTTSAQSSLSLAGALDALHAGHYKEAESQFRRLLEQNPKSAEILKDLGLAYQLQGDTDAAVHSFEATLRIKRLPEAVAMLALDYCRDHDFRRAVPLLNESKGYVSDPKIAETVGPCFLEADQPEDAVRVFEDLVRLGTNPQDENVANLVRAHLDLSRKLLGSLASLPGGVQYATVVQKAKSDGSLDATGLVTKAYHDAPYLSESTTILDAIRVLPDHRSDPALLYLLGTMCASRAAEVFDGLQDRWPDSIATGQLTAELKDTQGDREGAIETYEQIVADHADAPPSVHFALGLLYSERRRWMDALAQYRFATAQASPSLYLRQRLSEALVQLGNHQEDISLLTKVVAEPDAPFWALRDFGESVQSLGREQQAIGYLERAARLKPADANVHYHLLQAYHKMHMRDEELAELAIVKRLSEPRDAGKVTLESHIKQAKSFDSEHQASKAEFEWRAALSVDPTCPAALDGLSGDFIAQHKYQATIALLDDPKLAGQRTPVQAINLATAYAQTAGPERSAAVLRDAFNTSPDSIPVANELGKVLLQQGRYAEAADTLELVLNRPDADLDTQLLFIRSRIPVAPSDARLVALAKRLLSEHAENWEVHYVAGLLDANTGDLLNATAHLEKALKANPESAESQIALASVCRQLKDRPQPSGNQENTPHSCQP